MGAADGYELIDSGGLEKLERVGPLVVVRPAPQAAWERRLDAKAWGEAESVYHRTSQGGGYWTHKGGKEPAPFVIEAEGMKLRIKLTDFGHLGLFPEQMENWRWIEERVKATRGAIEVLNLFAYTGGSSLAAALAGAKVCHVDASKGTVNWARENLALNSERGASIRWIVEDALKFLKREVRRGRKYEAIIADPPSYGRGAQGEVWKIEESVGEMIAAARELMAENPAFALLTSHSAGFSAVALDNLMNDLMGKRGVRTSGEMVVPARSGRPLPSGTWCRWTP